MTACKTATDARYARLFDLKQEDVERIEKN
jgi:hypothetical protein